MQNTHERGLLDVLVNRRTFSFRCSSDTSHLFKRESDGQDGGRVLNWRQLLKRAPVPGIRVHQLPFLVVSGLTKSVTDLRFHVTHHTFDQAASGSASGAAAAIDSSSFVSVRPGRILACASNSTGISTALASSEASNGPSARMA
jgi:hypothetical protein